MTSGSGATTNGGQAYGGDIFVQGTSQTVMLTASAGQTLTISGVIADQSGSHDASGSGGSGSLVISGGGTVVLSPYSDGLATSNTYTGGTVISGGSTLELGDSGAAGAGGISLGSGKNELRIDGTTMPGNAISGFTASGDMIDLTGLAFSGSTSVGFNSATDMLTAIEGGGSATIQLDSETYDGISWVAQSDGVSGTDIGVVQSFCRGTLILTEAGEVSVEELAIGDKVVTLSGAAKPIRWIGRRVVAARFADPLQALPVRIMAGALDDGVPSCDLCLSPDHALLVDGALIQAGALVNGRSIVRQRNVPETFTYYHIELADHDLISAENTRAETFVDNVDRMGFDNWGEHRALYGDTDIIVEQDYPRAKAPRQVPMATRARLAARAARLYPTAEAA